MNPLPTDNRKILIALQFFAGDRQRASDLARLIADLEPRHSDKADFLFLPRFDCTPDPEVLKYVSRKFDVRSAINRVRGAEWPHGCNTLFFGLMEWVYAHKVAKMVPDYKAILAFEADGFPLTPDWITRLSGHWDQAKKFVVGAYQSNPAPHINGNAMFSGDLKFLKWISREVGGCPPTVGWDYYLAASFRKWGWADCGAMRSWWNMATLDRGTFDQLLEQQVCFLHGVKDSSVIGHVRSRFSA